MFIVIIILRILKLSHRLILKTACFLLLLYFLDFLFLLCFLLDLIFFLFFFLGLLQFTFFRILTIFAFHLFFRRNNFNLFFILIYFFFLRIYLLNIRKGSNFGFSLLIKRQLFQFLRNCTGVDLGLLLIIWGFAFRITK